MSHKRIIDPLNRIEGDLAIELSINEQNVIEDAKSLGFVYRGFENIFIGREPFDAVRMSQRSCGVCPVSHGTAGARALESVAENFKIPKNAQLIRDIVSGSNMIVSHLTHFYFMWGPDLVNEIYNGSKLYPEIVKRFNPLKSEHLRQILLRGRIPLHTVVATFGGKFPHPGHAVPGGVSCVPKHIEIIKTTTLLTKVKEFVQSDILNGVSIDAWLKLKSANELLDLLKDEKFANSDVGLFIQYCLEFGLHKLGEGTSNNFLSYGWGDNYDGTMLFKPGYVENGKYHDFDPSHISEDTTHAYYETEQKWRNPSEGITKPIPSKHGAYSWIKAARYFGHVCELGPLARQIVNGDPLITDLVRVYGVNTFTRTAARLHECLVILPKLIFWLDQVDFTKPFYYKFPELQNGKGVGLTEAPRGAVGHWVNIEDGVCKSYQIITPTTWNASPKDSNGQKGAIEQALIGVKLRNKDSILEAGHIVRSFDPCISCSIHAVGQQKRRSIFIDASR